MNFLLNLFKSNTIITSQLTVTSSNGFHLRPIAQFVNEAKKYNIIITLLAHDKEVSATQVPKILSLSLEKGETFTLKCQGKEAQEVNNKLSNFFQKLMDNDTKIDNIVQVSANYQAPALTGETIAKGIGIAPITHAKITERIEENSPISLRDAIQQTKAELSLQYEQHKEETSSQIFLAQKELLSSNLFNTNFSNIKEFNSIIQEETQKLKDGQFESRIADYEDLAQRVLKHLGIHKELTLPLFPYILIIKELLPSHIEQLNKTPIKGLVLQSGNHTSHAAILLRSAGIPSMIIKEEIQLSKNAILDANAGNLILTPTKEDFKEATQKQKKFIEALDKSFNKRFDPTETSSGKSIKILANITDLNSAKEAKKSGAEGVGLLRTEFLFTEKKPTPNEQQSAYEEIFKLFNEVTVRTLDIGGDKSLPYINIDKEDNPFLGIRGIRFSLQEQTLFKEQLLAIGLASANTPNAKIKIMFPMVSTTEEFSEAKAIALNVYEENNISTENIEFGIMLEVPSVIFALKAFDKEVDFYSIGSNDLTQYLFAIERTHPTLKVDNSSPILMDALAQIIQTTKKPVSICGELAGLEESTQALIEMGYSSLSVSSKLIPLLKERVRNV
ncbi:MAG: Phosphoenolpyruvate-protein phosphotransferase of PTS system (EC [uncultured Sulfurovum sp.]|uniref:Phosphoenolpyruvate-protein phosphotransferase of PTS system (EC) n=1 Tax=uncultured Sulfurovum sp. TaxID=269237 RepID=A0A6S6S9C6_9BACT|nr:MAG: Phosphoenolpyruvate-protein phosphotransferase of PTS system (EC [uncultured Sulfurovum sp.]